MADDLKLKGPVREIGIVRDAERHDSFNITIGIAIRTEGKVTYEEAERLSTKFRRYYLGKDVEFIAIHIPCPYCDKILNSEGGLKQHVLKVHPEKAELINPKVAAKEEKQEKKTREKKGAEKSTKVKGAQKARVAKTVKAEKAGRTTRAEKPKAKPRGKAATRAEAPPLERLKAKTELKRAPVLTTSLRSAPAKQQPKTKQLTLA